MMELNEKKTMDHHPQNVIVGTTQTKIFSKYIQVLQHYFWSAKCVGLD